MEKSPVGNRYRGASARLDRAWAVWPLISASGVAAGVMAAGMPALAQGYYYYPAPYYAPPPPSYVYPPPAYYYPPAVVVTPPPAQKGAPPPQFWYWCDDPKGYYPSVANCNRAWREVPGSGSAPAAQTEPKSK